MSSIKYIASFVFIAISVQGCAQRATAIAPAVVPTANYDGYECGELKSMLKLKTSQKISLEKRQNSAATWDAISAFSSSDCSWNGHPGGGCSSQGRVNGFAGSCSATMPQA
jgi:hypothetical protein